MDPLATRLRQERERQGLTTRDVSVVTKIREPYIEAIERGRYDVLPAVYVKSFVKTLSNSLAIPEQEIRQLMATVFDGDDDAVRLSRYQPEQTSQSIEQTMVRATEAVSSTVAKATEAVGTSYRKIRSLQPPTLLTDRPRIVMVLAMLAAIGVVALFVWLLSSSNESDDKGAQAVQEELSSEITVPSVSGAVSTADSMHLTADVQDTAWLTITMDGSHTRQQVLTPGDEYTWLAKNKFVLNISNAGGVRFYRDGEALPLFGRRGETVRSVTITRTDVISSAAPAGGISTAPSSNPAPTAKVHPNTNVRPATTKPTAAARPAPQPRAKPVVRRQQRQPVKRQQQPSRKATRSLPMITPAPIRSPR